MPFPHLKERSRKNAPLFGFKALWLPKYQIPPPTSYMFLRSAIITLSDEQKKLEFPKFKFWAGMPSKSVLGLHGKTIQ